MFTSKLHSEMSVLLPRWCYSTSRLERSKTLQIDWLIDFKKMLKKIYSSKLTKEYVSYKFFLWLMEMYSVLSSHELQRKIWLIHEESKSKN